MDNKEVNLIEEKDEICKIIEEKIKNKRIVFTDWYNMGLLRKGILEERFNEVFSKFEKVKRIEKESLKSGDIGYELFYELSNNTTVSIGTIPKEKILLIIHLIEYKRNLESRFKKFKQ